MKNTKPIMEIMAISAFVVALAAAPAVFAGYGSSGSSPNTMETAGQPMDDAHLAAMVKAELAADADLKTRMIGVETTQGIVKLTGTVESKAEKDKAIIMVKKLNGVKSVKDNLVVRGQNGGTAKP